MRFLPLALFLLATCIPSLLGQDAEAETETGLKANPEKDLYDLALLTYQEAVSSKDEQLQLLSYEAALRQFTRFLQHHADNPLALEAWYYSANCYDKLDQKDQALRCRRTIVSKWKTGPLLGLSAFQLANHHFELKEYKKAVPHFELSLKEMDHTKAKQLASYRTALCHQHLGDTENMISALETILADESSPYHPSARKALAFAYRQKGDNEKAYTLFRTLAQSDDPETQADALLQVALLARELGKSEETTEAFQKILSTPTLSKWHGEAQLFLMSEEAQQKNHAKVIALFEKSKAGLKSKEQKIKRLLLAIQAYEQSGKGDSTLPLYRQLKKIAPQEQAGFEAAYILLSRQYQKTKEAAFAKEARQFLNAYSKTKSEDSRLDNARLMLAETEFALKNFTTAAALYQKLDLSKIDSKNHIGLRYRLIVALRNSGDAQGASSALTDFLKLYPKDPRGASALAKRADASRDKKDFPTALKDYDLLLSLTQNATLREYAWSRKASIYKTTEDFPALIKTHSTLLKEFPKRPAKSIAASWFWKGWAQFRLDQFAECIEPFKKARSLAPKLFEKEATLHLALGRYQLQQTDALQKEVDHLHQNFSEVTLPRSLYAWLGVKLTAGDQLQEAWKYLPKAVELSSPQNTEKSVWLAYGKTALHTAHYQEAVPAYEFLLKEENDRFRKADYHYRLAYAQYHLKNHTVSSDQALLALELKPQGALNGKIRFLLGELARAQGDSETALQHYVVVVELYNEDQPTLHQALNAAVLILEEKGGPGDLAQAETYKNRLKSP